MEAPQTWTGITVTVTGRAVPRSLIAGIPGTWAGTGAPWVLDGRGLACLLSGRRASGIRTRWRATGIRTRRRLHRPGPARVGRVVLLGTAAVPRPGLRATGHRAEPGVTDARGHGGLVPAVTWATEAGATEALCPLWTRRPNRAARAARERGTPRRYAYPRKARRLCPRGSGSGSPAGLRPSGAYGVMPGIGAAASPLAFPRAAVIAGSASGLGLGMPAPSP